MGEVDVNVKTYKLVRTSGEVTVYRDSEDIYYCAIDDRGRFNLSLVADLCGVHLFRLFDRKTRSRFRQVSKQGLTFLHGLYGTTYYVDQILEHSLTKQIRERASDFLHYCYEVHENGWPEP